MEYLDVGTPLSNKYYLGQSTGEMYGLDHNIERFLPEVSSVLRPQSGIPGLYFTGMMFFTETDWHNKIGFEWVKQLIVCFNYILYFKTNHM